MFSGIVQAVGVIEKVESLEEGVRLTIAAGGLDLSDTRVGDSIAINGACMTATSIADARFTVDVSRESLGVTAGLGAPGKVNLEKSMALGERIDGHLVTGHVDGVGEVTAFEQRGESWRLEVRAPRELGRYIARKGSITVDGVSLTVNRVEDEAAGTTQGTVFEVNLIPHTLKVTTLSRLAPGSRVNLEIDLLARYVQRLLEASKPVPPGN